MTEGRKAEIEIFDGTKSIPLPKRLEMYQYSLEVFSTDGNLVCYDYKNKHWVRIDIYNDTIRYVPVEVKEWVSRVIKESKWE